MVSDQHGNIWIANCGNSSVTVYPKGDPRRARNIPQNRLGLSKPFGIAIDHRGFAWVTGNNSNSVAIIGNDEVRHVSGVFDRPMAIASDSKGNMWVANSHIVNVPCPNGGSDVDGAGGSIALIRSNGEVAARAPFTGGGTTSPWGLSVDGNDNVWVANFGNGRGAGGSNLLRISQFCGTDTSKCPPGVRTRSDFAAHRLHQRCPAADDRCPDRPLGQPLGHRQLEKGDHPEQSGRRCDRDLRRHRRASEGAADRTAAAALTGAYDGRFPCGAR